MRLARSAGLAGVATLASRILGLARETVLAALFGAGNEIDAFIVAFRIPNLVRDLFAEGAMSAAFVPTFTRHLTLKGRSDAWRLASNVLTCLLIVTGGIVIAGVVFARPLVTMYAGDYAQVPGKLDLTIGLTRVMLPFLMMVAVAAAAMGMLNSLHHYFIPALSPAVFNLATIVCALTLVPLMPALGQPRIVAIAIAALIGGLGQIAIQWPSLRREGFRYAPVFEPSDPGLRQVLLLMGPGTIGLAATQVNIFVNTLLATSQGTGAVAWLTYAFRLMYLPIGIFGVSIATAVLPAVSRHAALGDIPAMRSTLSRGLGMMLVLNVPATFGLVALATPIVQVLFEHGRFTPADTAATASVLRFYAIGLIGYSAARIASPTFYALGRSRVPVAASMVTIAINVVLSVALVRTMGFRGLALGTSLAALANGAILIVLLGRCLDGIEGRQLAVALAKITGASVLMVAAALATGRMVATILPEPLFLIQVVRLAASIGVALLVLAAAARALRMEELDEALVAIRSRLQNQK